MTKILSSGEALRPRFEPGSARIKEQNGLLRTGNGTSSPVFNIQEVTASILDLNPTILSEGFPYCHSKILLYYFEIVNASVFHVIGSSPFTVVN